MKVSNASLDPNSGTLRIRLDDDQHFPIIPTSKRPCCSLCRWVEQEKDVKNRSGIVVCDKCKVSLCIDCFKPFHTVSSVSKLHAGRITPLLHMFLPVLYATMVYNYGEAHFFVLQQWVPTSFHQQWWSSYKNGELFATMANLSHCCLVQQWWCMKAAFFWWYFIMSNHCCIVVHLIFAIMVRFGYGLAIYLWLMRCRVDRRRPPYFY